MPVKYTILKNYNLLILHYDGEVTLSELAQNRLELLRDTDFQPSYAQLVDLRSGQMSNLSTADVRSLSSSTIFNPGVKRAIVAPNDLEFGMARMFGVFVERFGQQVRVFRSIEEACEWLGVPVSALPTL
jgi:hypothetical protein